MIYTDHTSPYIAEKLKQKYHHADLAPFGANILVSPVNMPPIAPKLIEAHLEAKAQLIQLRTSIDWFHNQDIFIELEKMMKYATTYPQRVLCLHMSSSEANVRRVALDWQRRGGIAIIDANDIVIQLEEMLSWLTEKLGETKRLWSNASDSTPLQELESVSAQENFMAAMPGIGEKKATDLWEAYSIAGLGYIMHLLTQVPESFKHYGVPLVSGIGEKTNQRLREFFGLLNHYELSANKIDDVALKARLETKEFQDNVSSS